MSGPDSSVAARLLLGDHLLAGAVVELRQAFEADVKSVCGWEAVDGEYAPVLGSIEPEDWDGLAELAMIIRDIDAFRGVAPGQSWQDRAIALACARRAA